MNLQENIKRILKEETSGKNRIKDMVLNLGWKTTAEMVGGFDNLYQRTFNGSSKGFMDLYSNLEIEDGYSVEGNYKFKSLKLNGNEIIRINERDNQGMISRDKIWSFFVEFGWTYYEIDTFLRRWLNKTYGFKVSECHAYYSISPDNPFR
jgi:hypothetical protein